MQAKLTRVPYLSRKALSRFSQDSESSLLAVVGCAQRLIAQRNFAEVLRGLARRSSGPALRTSSLLEE